MKRSMDKRIAALEASDRARMARVYDRVLQALSDDELERFGAVMKRHEAAAGDNALVSVSGEEKQALCRVEALTRADPEMRPGDLMHIPQEWMQEGGYAAQ